MNRDHRWQQQDQLLHEPWVLYGRELHPPPQTPFFNGTDNFPACSGNPKLVIACLGHSGVLASYDLQPQATSQQKR